MDEENPVLVKMTELLDNWETSNDRRLIFLTCYKLMTQNIINAIETNDFEDVAWVSALMDSFADYYFRALEAYESKQTNLPAAWQIAFNASHNSRTHIVQDLVLGVNAHINYDLVFALAELLASEWQQLSAEQRQMRYRDHCHVNDIINQTTNAVQDQVVDRYVPIFGVVDTILGPIDEWMTSLLISEWREEVWEHALLLVNLPDPQKRQDLIRHIEETSIQRAKEILGKGGLTGLIEFI